LHIRRCRGILDRRKRGQTTLGLALCVFPIPETTVACLGLAEGAALHVDIARIGKERKRIVNQPTADLTIFPCRHQILRMVMARNNGDPAGRQRLLAAELPHVCGTEGCSSIGTVPRECRPCINRGSYWGQSILSTSEAPTNITNGPRILQPSQLVLLGNVGYCGVEVGGWEVRRARPYSRRYCEKAHQNLIMTQRFTYRCDGIRTTENTDRSKQSVGGYDDFEGERAVDGDTYHHHHTLTCQHLDHHRWRRP
jgi:hypothetical protein